MRLQPKIRIAGLVTGIVTLLTILPARAADLGTPVNPNLRSVPKDWIGAGVPLPVDPSRLPNPNGPAWILASPSIIGILQNRPFNPAPGISTGWHAESPPVSFAVCEDYLKQSDITEVQEARVDGTHTVTRVDLGKFRKCVPIADFNR